MGKVVVFTNLKGGVGKTSDTDIISLVSSQLFKKKVLLIDVDMQANSTQNMSRTFNITDYPQSFIRAVQNRNLRKAIIHLSPTLDFIAGSSSAHELNDWILDHSSDRKKRYLFFKDMVEPLKEKYDYIFFDVAPSTDNTVDAIMMCTDYIVAVQEVKRFSMDGTEMLINDYLAPMLAAFPNDAHFQVAGILPAILQNRRKQQISNYRETIEKFGKDNVFNTIIKHHDRIEGWGETGIALKQIADVKMWALFADLFCELEKRIESFEKTGDVLNFTYTPKYYDSMNNELLSLGKEIERNGIIKQ
ncbi:ParA superfamily DNA segregation protein PrgP [Ligilactobacillus aviarius]|uniref:ParA superfamily DNA segregation protein PrgP n=1 Tax=Ligilactobacillus TaxID=2767887 RepID=UPI0025A31AED|nr:MULTISPECIES: ParA superfamily DNA segregation protein PrgP [Ligilactobacillus]MDM8278856.1 ParA superfamily DNA segregation protein PrgP [Ligilactobacillus aviarius]MDO3394074.1 ParA superfamily DNA segregation protein PrgP [Ligilactobacillus sp. 110_WCHN]